MKIKAKKDLFNHGLCFTKGNIYFINSEVKNSAGLMEKKTVNDQGENHLIGSWWRNFELA